MLLIRVQPDRSVDTVFRRRRYSWVTSAKSTVRAAPYWMSLRALHPRPIQAIQAAGGIPTTCEGEGFRYTVTLPTHGRVQRHLRPGVVFGRCGLPSSLRQSCSTGADQGGTRHWSRVVLLSLFKPSGLLFSKLIFENTTPKFRQPTLHRQNFGIIVNRSLPHRHPNIKI